MPPRTYTRVAVVQIACQPAITLSGQYELRVRRFVRTGERGWEEHADKLGPFSPGS